MNSLNASPPPVTSPVAHACFHCGDDCKEHAIRIQEKLFCCEGCKLVFEILQENHLGSYYELNTAPGSKGPQNASGWMYDFLDDEPVLRKLISFTDGTTTHITFHIPQMHCSSCIWLLEHFHKLDPGVVKSTVHFLKREVYIIFRNQETSVRKIAGMLDSIGYAPRIGFDQLDQKSPPTHNRKTWYKLGVAFFCFGNIMLLSFPEYFGLTDVFEPGFRNLFGYLNVLLSLPVLLYADSDFFRSAYLGLRHGRLNMDFPIALGIAVMYSRSFYEIVSGTGAGYMDTFAGLVFFMLSGRLFQNKTYDRISFERDFKSYFPIAVTVLKDDREYSKSISDLRPGDRVLIRNEELVPADCILIEGEGRIDYSFVTGESVPVAQKRGDLIYAGGRQSGAAIELEIVREVMQSRLTQLWNENNFKTHGKRNNLVSITDSVSLIFTLVILCIALTAGGWHAFAHDWNKALNAFTAVLIITCPCALALSYPITLGHSLRILGRNGLYLKNTRVIEHLAHADTVVFDKTGTLTHSGESHTEYIGTELSEQECSMVYSLCCQSNHPLSRILARHFSGYRRKPVCNFTETPGLGIEGTLGGRLIRIGARTFAAPGVASESQNGNLTRVFISIDGDTKGLFMFRNVYRQGWDLSIKALSGSYDLHVLSGDNNGEQHMLQPVFGQADRLHFNQQPEDKLHFVQQKQTNGKQVLMLGDGLNDAGALKQSDVGIAVSDNINNFSPASDGILEAESLVQLPSILRFSRKSLRIIYASYVISLMYNLAGITVAVQGALSPLFAAIIMPLSTVTIVLFTTLASSVAATSVKLKI